MTIPSFPNVRAAREAEWYLMANTQTQTSPFDGTTQTVIMPGARWRGTATYLLQMADFRTLQAFMASLGGRGGRFLYGPPQTARRATAAVPGPVQIDGAGQTGTVVNLKGFPAATLVFEAGDWLSWPDADSRPQLHQVTAPVTSDGAGLAAVPIAPPIRHSGADSAAVEITAPTGVFMLIGDDQGRATQTGDQPGRGQISFEVIEAIV